MSRARSTYRRHALATAVVLAFAGAAHAQLSTSTIKGQVTSAGARAQPGLIVTAVNPDTGNTYRSTTLTDGSYVLTGLAPGSYEIRVTGPAGTAKTQVVTVQVGETAALDLALSGTVTPMERVEIVGSALRQGVRDSQVGTSVSQKMIESLPQVTRNFLSSADLAPGVAFSADSGGNTKIQSGSQDFDHVNVFIDGIGQKNNILRGGLSGQDSSRGNPFPQSAIAEYRVLTQNYKAEFDQVSSAAITAITKSGTNTFHGDAYVDRTSTSWRSLTVFEREREAAGVKLPPSSKHEFGVSLGGPIVQDRVHFFVAYDGKDIDSSRQIVVQNLDRLPASRGIVPSLVALQGSEVDPFLEHLLFGKVDAEINPDHRLTFSTRVRRESDRRPENSTLSAHGNDKDRTNDETRFDLKHEWTHGAWLSEARLGYEYYRWNPHSAATEPFVMYRVSTATPQRISGAQAVLFVGGSPDAQDRAQRGTFVSEEVTYTGLSGHVFKGGGRVKGMKYDLSGASLSVDSVNVLIDNVTGQPYYDGTNCTGTNITNSGLNSDQCAIRRATAANTVAYKNTQIGLYFQDDWAVTKRLELNLGVRYDYETNMLNNDYVTPADRVAALNQVDRTRFGITPPAGQTYAQSLARGGININDYISNGNSRKVFKSGIAPRVGASYDVFGDLNSVVFGGWGRSYDRSMANHAISELNANASPGGEIWLIRNDFKMPYADQFTLGLRQALGKWNAEVAVSRVHARNQFIWYGGDRDPNGGFGNSSPIDPLFSGPFGFRTLILGDFVGENKTDALFVKAEKPYTRSSGWGVNIAYTYSDAKTTHRDWNNDIFDWTYARPGARGFNRSRLVDEHRLVAAGVMDNLPWGITVSGKATWASGMPRRIVNTVPGAGMFTAVEGDAPSFRQVDLGVSKELNIVRQMFRLRADVLNAFNTKNYGGFDDSTGNAAAPGAPANALGGTNLNLGKPNSIRGDPRTFRLMVSYRF